MTYQNHYGDGNAQKSTTTLVHSYKKQYSRCLCVGVSEKRITETCWCVGTFKIVRCNLVVYKYCMDHCLARHHNVVLIICYILQNCIRKTKSLCLFELCDIINLVFPFFFVVTCENSHEVLHRGKFFAFDQIEF